MSYSFDGYRDLGLHPFFTTVLCFNLHVMSLATLHCMNKILVGEEHIN